MRVYIYTCVYGYVGGVRERCSEDGCIRICKLVRVCVVSDDLREGKEERTVNPIINKR